MPLRETIPTGPGMKMSPGRMPSLQQPGVMMPGQLGPTSRHPLALTWAQIFTMSSTGIHSLMQTMSGMRLSAASTMASPAKRAGTKLTVALTPVASTASRTDSNTGTPSTYSPPWPGAVPATTWVP